MGQCGCGESIGLVKLPAPDGTWFIIEVYPGCSACGPDWALSIYHANHEWDEGLYDDVPEVTFGDRGQWATTILDGEVLLKHFAEHTGEVETDTEDEYGTPSDAMQDFVRQGCLRDVHFDSLERHTQEGAEDVTTREEVEP